MNNQRSESTLATRTSSPNRCYVAGRRQSDAVRGSLNLHSGSDALAPPKAMTTQPLRPPLPPHLQPNAKSSSTAKSSQLSAVANATPVASRNSSRTRPVKERDTKTAGGSDGTSQQATLSLIRRVLAPETGHGNDGKATPRPVEDVLPPLTSSNEVDTQLYAIIAIVIKEFVYAWYSKITPDHIFVEEVIHIIAHCSRALEGRLRQNDIAEIVLDEIPTLVQRHILLYRIAAEKCSDSAYSIQPLQIYHTLNPHPALTPVTDPNFAGPSLDQVQNEAIYRQLLVQGALAVLLPTEDLENASLRTLVGDIVADLILGQAVAEKVCEGWFLHEAITKVVEVLKARIEPKASGEELHQDTRSRLEQFGLLSNRATEIPHHSSKSRQSRPSALFWQAMQWIYLGSIFVRFMLVGMFQSRRLPARYRYVPSSTSSPIRIKSPSETAAASPLPPTEVESWPRPVLNYRIFDFISTVLDLSGRMPWLASSCAFVQNLLSSGAGRLGSTNSTLDKFLHHTILTHALSPSLLPTILLNLRANLFPNNTIGPPGQPPPLPEEARRKAALAVLSLIPPLVARKFFASSDPEEWLSEVEEILDCFSNKAMNKHLIYGIIELVLVRLIPELSEKSPRELLVDRIGEEKALDIEVSEKSSAWDDEESEGDARMEAMKYFGDTV